MTYYSTWANKWIREVLGWLEGQSERLCPTGEAPWANHRVTWGDSDRLEGNVDSLSAPLLVNEQSNEVQSLRKWIFLYPCACHRLICTVLFLWGKDLHPGVETWIARHKYCSQEIEESVLKCYSPQPLRTLIFFSFFFTNSEPRSHWGLANFTGLIFSLLFSQIFSPWITATNIKLNSRAHGWDALIIYML